MYRFAVDTGPPLPRQTNDNHYEKIIINSSELTLTLAPSVVVDDNDNDETGGQQRQRQRTPVIENQ